jgi:hypothetical protein
MMHKYKLWIILIYIFYYYFFLHKLTLFLKEKVYWYDCEGISNWSFQKSYIFILF